MWPRYLLWFAYEHIDFRHAELKSILSLYNIPINYIEKPCQNKPYLVVELPSEECVRKIASRSVLLKNGIELWSRAKSEKQLHVNLKNALQNTSGDWISGGEGSEAADLNVCPKELIDKGFSKDKSFKIEVETFCKHFTMPEKVAKIENFSYLPLAGHVNLRSPDERYAYIEYYGVDPNNVPDDPHDVFFGKWIADGQRDLIQVHSLKKRQFIGNTSMDAQLALLMANQAQVKDNDVILDPFVGSGSLLVAAAHFGAHVWGSDIDFMMLHSKTRPTRAGLKVRTKDESIRGNMRQYGTESRYLDLVVSDFSLPVWHDRLKFDAIITDPPYGVREPTEKIGIEKDNYTLTEEHLLNHVPAKVEYGLPHIYSDLLNFAAKHLEMGRRLVCWYPLVREEFQESDLPSHPCMRLVHNSEQLISRLAARRLLTYEKIQHHLPLYTAEPIATNNYRDKYFSVGDTTRREQKEKKAKEIAAIILARSKAHSQDT